jgi:hypothetical protein
VEIQGETQEDFDYLEEQALLQENEMELNVCLQDVDPASVLAQSLQQIIMTGQGTNILLN